VAARRRRPLGSKAATLCFRGWRAFRDLADVLQRGCLHIRRATSSVYGGAQVLILRHIGPPKGGRVNRRTDARVYNRPTHTRQTSALLAPPRAPGNVMKRRGGQRAPSSWQCDPSATRSRRRPRPTHRFCPVSSKPRSAATFGGAAHTRYSSPAQLVVDPHTSCALRRLRVAVLVEPRATRARRGARARLRTTRRWTARMFAAGIENS